MDREAQPPDRDAPGAGCGADADVLSALLRCRDQYHWSWNFSMRLINRRYGTQYTEKQLKSLYRSHAQKN